MQRVLRILFLGSLALVVSGCVTTEEPPAPVSDVLSADADSAARFLAAQEEGRLFGRGSGVSMLPIYGENTRVIVTPIPFDDLEPGMIVAYRDSSNRMVVHRLVSRRGDRWTASGINNPQIDRDAVTRENLIGVVYAFIHGEARDGQGADRSGT